MRGAMACALIVVLVAVACTTERPSVQPTAAGPDPDLVRSRELLGGPIVALAEAAQVLADDLDAARHEVARGDGVLAALEAVGEDIAALRRTANDVLAAARLTPMEDAVAVAQRAVTDALAAADAGKAEADHLRALARIDRRLLHIAAGWDRPGSQSEQRARLTAHDDVIAEIARLAGRLRAQPRACPALSRHRVAWARLVRSRTRELAEHANSFSGERYDELRDGYRRSPLGENPLEADAADRTCWTTNSDVPNTADDLRKRVEELEQVLQ